ncbi:hypothetical protein ECA1277 [Pectobacterium atrosepticum SCRI1043]|uniref:Uncharacterized protein n=1 Tax=Pectobacterium atrosepticum (strain SCRI 1043 / ATCC BAA-672) TaxID=218491 RepID=Q6D7P8_PECAS|nr:hypothetical protein [Pectobacterium atrosepticum]GKV86454.1 hypothetical protein PEC301296_27650 [Pectobacterium carotovorum subsp. carotovorum]ATY90059.1 hypothetical protein CVS35_06655 [Pectobacterium atrosepticum]KFX24933.1 hypothetical protein KP24_07765 [Pectobacterium atrosepticum]MBL0893843.1 hypothetical protein [Pectobacterium atrosepticum]MCA6976805.1 hypothetical protein [Pectobacterium atrosepticum]
MTGDRDEIYRLVDELLRSIQHGDPAALVDFGVNPAIYEEILEELGSVGETIAELTLPPYDMAFTPDRTGRIPLCSYAVDATPQRKRVECQLWSGEKKTALTLIADYSDKQGKAPLVFRLLETQ